MLFEQGRALIIGVGEYDDPRLSRAMPTHAGVALAALEAAALSLALTNPAQAAYPKPRAALLTGAQATRQGIVKALEQLAAQTAQQDTVFLYFCGHAGLGDDGEYYFATRDAALVDDTFRHGTALSAGELLALLRRVQAEHLVLVLNTAFAGGGDAVACFGQPGAEFKRRMLATGTGRAMITAARANEFSYINTARRTTYFGDALTGALLGNRVPLGKYISLYDLFASTYASVQDVATKARFGQEPVLTIVDGSDDFPVAMFEGGRLGSTRGGINIGGGSVIVGRDILGGDRAEVERGAQVKVLRSARVEQLPLLVVYGLKLPVSFAKEPPPFIPETKGPGTLGPALGKDILVEHAPGTLFGGALEIFKDVLNKAKLFSEEPQDMPQGDEIKIGDISGNIGIAVGDHASSTVNINIQSSGDPNAVAKQVRAALVPEHLIAEKIRLDVASPAQVFVGQTFAIGVAVRQPDAPQLQIQDLPQVTFEEGEILRAAAAEIIDYRVELDAPDFEIAKSAIHFRLRKNENSTVKYFVLQAKRAGKLPVVVNAYQEQYEVASARLTLESFIHAVNR